METGAQLFFSQSNLSITPWRVTSSCSFYCWVSQLLIFFELMMQVLLFLLQMIPEITVQFACGHTVLTDLNIIRGKLWSEPRCRLQWGLLWPHPGDSAAPQASPAPSAETAKQWQMDDKPWLIVLQKGSSSPSHSPWQYRHYWTSPFKRAHQMHSSL